MQHPPHIDNKCTQVDTARAHQGTFATEHAVLQLLFQVIIFATTESSMTTTYIEIRKLPCRASRRASPTTDTQFVGRHTLQHLIGLVAMQRIHIYGTGLRYCETEFVHFNLF
jgi:hypothetical protein